MSLSGKYRGVEVRNSKLSGTRRSFDSSVAKTVDVVDKVANWPGYLGPSTPPVSNK